jgi:hypothetical protein
LARRICGSLSAVHPFTAAVIVVLVIVVVPRFVALTFVVIWKTVDFAFAVVWEVLQELLLHCLGLRRRGVEHAMPCVPIHGLFDVADAYRGSVQALTLPVINRRLMVGTYEGLDVCTVPVVRGEGCRWIQPRRWGGVSELALDLNRWGVLFSW